MLSVFNISYIYSRILTKKFKIIHYLQLCKLIVSFHFFESSLNISKLFTYSSVYYLFPRSVFKCVLFHYNVSFIILYIALVKIYLCSSSGLSNRCWCVGCNIDVWEDEANLLQKKLLLSFKWKSVTFLVPRFGSFGLEV